MKVLALSLLAVGTLACASESIIGEFGNPSEPKASGIAVNTGAWYMTWDQTSTSQKMLQNSNDALDTTYQIDNAVAAMVDISVNYGYLSGDVKYYSNSGIEGYDVNLALLKLIPYINVEARYVNANFTGNMDIVRRSDGVTDYAKFKSPLEIYDILIYPFNEYIGFGYRSYKYEVPQDFYLINNSDGSLVTTTSYPTGIRGWADIRYSGSFYTLVVDNKKLVNLRSDYNGLIYSGIIGMGKLSPKNIEYSSLDQYMADSDAVFYDISLGYSYKHKSNNGFGYGLGVGYRYNKIETKMNTADGGYTLATEFNTEFHGPFVDVTLSY